MQGTIAMHLDVICTDALHFVEKIWMKIIMVWTN
jgi:hypothetical protein